MHVIYNQHVRILLSTFGMLLGWLLGFQTVSAAVYLNGIDVETIISGQNISLTPPIVVTADGVSITDHGYIFLTFLGDGIRGSCNGGYDPSFTYPDWNTRQVESSKTFDTWYCDNGDILTVTSQTNFKLDTVGIDASHHFYGMANGLDWSTYPILTFAAHSNSVFGSMTFSGVPSQLAAATVSTSGNFMPLLAVVIAVPLTFWFIMRLIEMFAYRNRQRAARDLFDERETYNDMKK